MKRFTLFLKLLSIVFVAALFSGCSSMPIPISEIRVNAKLYVSPDVLADKITQLKPEMTKRQVFDILGINKSTPNLRSMSEQDIRLVIYGETHPTTFEDGERFHSRAGKLEGLELPYVFKKRSAALAFPFHVQYVEKGHELAVVMIFMITESASESLLFDKRIVGVAIIDKTEKRILYNPFSGVKPLSDLR
jgi:hypothetical protein